MRILMSVARHTGWIVLCLIQLVPTAQAAVGRTNGAFGVSPTGSATYTIPIWAPRGPNGLQPTLALTYNSQGGYGYLGVGWSLSGLSVISRCNATWAQDGTPAAVALTYSDRFCLDGQRLRLTSSENLGTYGQPGTTYQTEVANFSNITASSTTTGSGPAYFTVQGRDGLTYEYGNGGYSQVTLNGSAVSWYLDKVTDRAGNTMTFSYTAPDTNLTGMTTPASISWTPTAHGASAYTYTMQFSYTTVTIPSIAKYVSGSQVLNAYLLNGIVINMGGETIKNYVLGYTAGTGSSRETLTSVKECADLAQTNCLYPTAITYQQGQAGLGTLASAASTLPAPPAIGVADFDGDGRSDFLNFNGSTWQVYFGGNAGVGAAVPSGLPAGLGPTGDVLGSGADGVLAPVNGEWWYYTWDSSSGAFSGQSINNLPVECSPCVGGRVVLSDVDGDGLPDLVTINSDGWVHVRLNTSSGTTPSFSETSISAFQLPSGAVAPYLVAVYPGGRHGHYADFNGDGRDDLLLRYTIRTTTSTDVYWSELISNGSTYADSFTIQNPTFVNQAGSSNLVDWNDDGCTDVFSAPYVFISPCNGSPANVLSLGLSSSQLAFAALDWNGDGRSDLLVYDTSNKQVEVYLSTGTGTVYGGTTSLPYGTYVIAADIDGDGLDDAIAANSVSPYSIDYALHNAAGQAPDLLSNVTDGYGNSASPSYVPITQNNYSSAWNSTYSVRATYPERPYVGPLYVVNQVTFSDPSSSTGGTYQQTYWYYDAWMNLQGRGFDGFMQVARHDLRNGLWDTTGYLGGFPLNGVFAWDSMSLDQAGNQVVRFSYANVENPALDSTPYNERYFVYDSNLTTLTYEVGGSKNGQLIKTDATTYVVDSYDNPTTITETVTDKDSSSPYYNQTWTRTTSNTPDVDTTNWCLNLFTETQVTYSASVDSPSVTQTKIYVPDTTNCHYSEIVTQPNTGNQVEEVLGYDQYGNISSDSVTGTGMGAASPGTRTTNITWSNPDANLTTGQFPLSVQDPSGAITQYAYNYSYGLRSSQTDPNGDTTSWQYSDGFGHKTEETRPDATRTTWNYNPCASSGGCLLGANSLAVATTVSDGSGNVLTSGTTYFDPLGRSFLSTQAGLPAGTFTRTERRFDNLGHVASQAMPCTWSGVSTPCPYLTTYSYDALNRLTQSQRPVNSSNSSLQTQSYQYQGDLTTLTDANGNARYLFKDSNGRLRITQDAAGYGIILGYDAAGSKNSVKDNEGNVLWSGSYQYGVGVFLTSMTDTDLGTWSFGVNALGEMTGWEDAKGQFFSMTYDALSRPTARYEPDLYTQWTWGTSASAHEIGQLHSVCTGTGTNPTSCTASPGYAEGEFYDSVGRLNSRAIQIPGDTTYYYAWQYGANGLLNTMTYPTGNSGALQVQYAYVNQLLTSVTDVSDSPNVTFWTANAINPAGQITKETLGNGVVVIHNFDAVTGWPASITAGVNGGTALQNNSFLFDYVGNLTQRQDNNAGTTENVFPDTLNRLDHTVGDSNTQITYDSNDRLASWAVYNGTVNVNDYTTQASGCTYYANAQLHAVRQKTQGTGVATYCYDANGNQLSTTWRGALQETHTWTSYNQPNLMTTGWPNINTGTSTSQFFYDQNHQRWKQIASYSGSLETTEYIGGLLEKMTNASATQYRYYVPVGNSFVEYVRSSTSSTPAIYFATKDHLGSTSVLTDQNGTLIANDKFSATGINETSAAQQATAAAITRHEYTGQEGMDNFYYTNLNGRILDTAGANMDMLSPDPNIPDPSNTLSYNRYAYVNYNPLTYIDPSGYDCENTATGPCYEVTITGTNYSPPPDSDLPEIFQIGRSPLLPFRPLGPSDLLPNGVNPIKDNDPGSQQQAPKNPSVLCSSSAIDTIAGAVGGAVGGAIGGAAEGPEGIVAGAALGALFGAAVGYAGSGDSSAGSAIAGGVIGGGASMGSPGAMLSNAYGGAFGGAVAYQLQQSGTSAYVAGPVGGAAGGALGAGVAGMASYFAGATKSLATVGKSVLTGGVTGAIAAGVTAAVTAGLTYACNHF